MSDVVADVEAFINRPEFRDGLADGAAIVSVAMIAAGDTLAALAVGVLAVAFALRAGPAAADGVNSVDGANP